MATGRRYLFGGKLKRTITFFIDGKSYCWQKGLFVEIPSNNKTSQGHMVVLRNGKSENVFHFKTWAEVQELVEIPEHGGVTEVEGQRSTDGEKDKPDGKLNYL